MDTARLAFEQDLTRFVKAIKAKCKEDSLLVRNEKGVTNQSLSYKTLLNIWNNYEAKLDKKYLESKYLVIGEFLYSAGEYGIAVTHCFMRFLMKFGESDAPFHLVSDGMSFEEFKNLYFATGLEDEEAVKTMRVMLGISMSQCFYILTNDSALKNMSSVYQLVNCLKVIQMTMQFAMANEHFCWLVYNGTIHIYTICRHLMTNCYASHAVEYLLWASVCMESSVPLMTTKYLPWRSQLYIAVCHCYYDINLGAEAEAFARRGLNLVQELEEIDRMSVSSFKEENKKIFKGASMKMKMMIFKRNVYESRRRPKGILRPKNKPSLKEISQNSWPRTTTERMLSETFQGRSAQLLAVIEALTDSKRRIAQTSLGAPDSDDSILDVFAELFFAGSELIAGVRGTRSLSPGKHDSVISENIEDSQLIDMAMNGEDKISFSSVVDFVKLAYNYESWEVFESLVQPITSRLRPLIENEKHHTELKALEVLRALLPLNMSKFKKKVVLGVDEKDSSEVFSAKHTSARVTSFVDDLLKLVNAVESCISGDKSRFVISGIKDILVDSCHYLWSRCKVHFSKVTSYSVESFKTVLQDPHLEKWIRVLLITQKAMLKLGLANVDVSACAEASIKAAVLVELLCSENAPPDRTSKWKRADWMVKADESDLEVVPNDAANLYLVAAVIGCAPSQWNVMLFAKTLLQSAMNSIDQSKSNGFDDQVTVVDDSLLKDVIGCQVDSVAKDSSALRLELIFVHHRIDCKLSIIQSASKESNKSPVKTEQLGMSSCTGRDHLSKAAYLICKAELLHCDSNREESNGMLLEAIELLEKSQKMESRLSKDSNAPAAGEIGKELPPPPLLLYRSATSMVFKPASFTPINIEVYCYKFFMRSASGHNVKVRLSDTQFPGTGIEVINNKHAVFTVTGLKRSDKYVVAVAAYTRSGQLIRNSIGYTSRPVLASDPLPIGLAYGHLTKVAFGVGSWDLAKKSFNILWRHFVDDTSTFKKEEVLKSARENTELTLHQLNMVTVGNSCPVILRYFVQSIFISVDIAVREGALFCDAFCDLKPPFAGQTSRMDESKKLLIALKVAGIVNDSSLCLQTVIMCYGLLAPLLQLNIHFKPLLQILIPCIATLQELQTTIKARKPTSVSENLHHMVSAITFYIAKVLENHQHKYAAMRIIECGGRILTGEAQSGVPDSASTSNNTVFGMGPGQLKKLGKRNTLKKIKVMAGKIGVKGQNENLASDSISSELKVLETYLHRLRREAEIDSDEDHIIELNGTEEGPYVHAILACLPPQSGFKEVSKFKRRAQYLEHFVHVLDRALKDGLQTMMIDWTRDAMAWLTRRNEVLINKQAVDQRGGAVVVAAHDEEKNKAFSAAVVEYGKAPKVNTSRELLPIAESPRLSGRKEEAAETKNVHKPTDKKTRSKGQVSLTDADKILKDATQKLQDLLPDCFKMVLRRRRLRAVTYEELPWRTQMNLLMARCFCDLSREKFKALVKFHSLTENARSSDLMDPNWFNLSTCGALVVSWAGNPKETETEIEPTIDIGGQNIDHTNEGRAASMRIDHISGKGKVTMKLKGNTTKSSKRENDLGGQNSEDAVKVYRTYLQMALLHFKRSIILARRGKNWVLLQSAARELHSFSTEINKKMLSMVNTDFLKSHNQLPLDVASIRDLFWSTYYVAADSLLDMLSYSLWDMKEKIDMNSSTLTSSDKFFNTGVREYNGASDLQFNPIFDDISSAGLIWFKRIIWYAIETMYYEEKWEKVVDLIYRFSALSRDKFAESLLPILIYSQRKIKSRIASLPGPPKEQPRVVFDRETGIPMAAYLNPPETASIEAGAHIDPEGHNLYNPALDSLQLVSVPVNTSETLERLNEALNSRQYSGRALEHCRKLLTLFLAGKQNGMNSKVKLRLGTRVSFMASQVQPQDSSPPDLSQERFEDQEAVEKYPLGENQLAIIISAYDKAIEILKYRNQTGLAAQAMHELGNIMYHAENTRLAYKWWLETLDLILKCKDALKTWRSLLTEEKKSIRNSKALLDHCGIWGCLLGAVLASKIARYIYTLDLGMRSEFCQISVAMYQALLCSSLPHPSSYIDYACYEVGLQHGVKELIPGVDLFSDPFRADCGTVVASLYWSSSELIRSGFYLEALPVLTLCQYVSVDVCKDVKKSVEVKILRVKALSSLNLFSEAIRHLDDIFRGINLPIMMMNKQPKITQTAQKIGTFDNSKKLSSSSNYKVLKEFCCATVMTTKAEVYGSKLCERVELLQANLLSSISSTINDFPENEVLPSPPSVNTDVLLDVKRSSNKFKKPTMRKRNLRSKSGSPFMQSRAEVEGEEPGHQDMANIKGLLLNTCEKIVMKVQYQLEGKGKTDEGQNTERLNAEDLQLMCDCEVELASVAEKRLCSITAAKHVCNIMKRIEMASLLEENDHTDDLKKMSWSSGKFYPEESITHANPDVNIDARLWLQLRLRMSTLLSSLVKMPTDDQTSMTQSTVGTFEYHTNQGLKEADAFNDKETHCKLTLLVIENAVRSGEDVDEIINSLKSLIEFMTSLGAISFELRTKLMEAKVLLNDLQAVSGKFSLADASSSNQYLLHEMLDEVVFLGNDVNSENGTILEPLSNIYDPLLVHVFAMKLRIGKCLALAAEEEAKDAEVCTKMLRKADGILQNVLEVSQKVAKEDPALTMEISFLIALLKSRLFNMEKLELKDAIEAIIEAIKVQTKHTPDLSMLRNMYQEISLCYMTYNMRTEAAYLKMERQRQLEEGEKEKERISSSGRSSSRSVQGSSKQTIQQQKQLQAKRDKESRAREKARQSMRKAAWLAARTAGVIAKAQKKFEFLATDAVEMSKESKDLLPPFFALHEILKTDTLIKDSESGLVVNNGVVRAENRFGKAESFHFSWSHVVNYARALTKQTSYVGMGLGTSNVNLRRASKSDQYDLKLKIMHNFLKESLVIYEKECCPILPIDFFLGLTFATSVQAPTPVNIQTDGEERDGKRGDRAVDVVTDGNITPIKEAEGANIAREPLPEMTKNQSSVKVGDRSDRIHSRNPMQAGDFEVAIQWHRPELSLEDNSTFIYAMNSKSISFSDKPASFAGFVFIDSLPVSWPADLHHDLTEIFHTAESELSQTSGALSKPIIAVQAASSLASVTPTRRKKPPGIKAISVEQDKEDQVKAQLKAVLDKIHAVFNKPEAQDIQFDVSFQNIACLQNLFNPAFGNILKTNEGFFNWLQYLFNGK